MESLSYKSAPIKTFSKFCSTLGLSEDEILKMLEIDDDKRYNDPATLAYKKDGTQRIIKCPIRGLRKIQQLINNRIFKQGINWPGYLFGSIPKASAKSNRDYVECASVHCGAKSICKIDVSNFFDNIEQFYVKELFKGFFHFEDNVADVMANLCCYKGSLVQGALTSSYIATLILWDLEGDIVKKLSRKNVRYTRLVDDITLSTEISNFGFDVQLKQVENMLLLKELPVNKDKFEFNYVSMEPLTVHGLRVCFKKPALLKDDIKNIRASVHNLVKLASQPNARTEIWFRARYFRCMGRVNKLARLGHSKHKSYIRKLRMVHPLPSLKDIKYAKIRIDNLKKDFNSKSDTYNYYKRYHLVSDRLKLIGLSYPDVAKQLRCDMDDIKPKFNKRFS